MLAEMRTFIWAVVCCSGAVLFFVFGCDDSSPPVDKDYECDVDAEPSGCLEGQLCLVGRCYDPCQADSDCSRWERCQDRLCRGSNVPQGDADIPTPDADADSDVDGDGDGDGDADTDADADGDGGIDCSRCDGGQCHGVTGECVDCMSSDVCLTLPVCDVARGNCVDFAAAQCAPCRTDYVDACGGLSCVDRRTREGEPWEVVCMTPCASGCPDGTQCTADTLYCEPIAQVSCTGWYSAYRNRTCGSDSSSCLDLGSTSMAVTCSEGEPPTCVISCPLGTECPPGYSCQLGVCGV